MQKQKLKEQYDVSQHIFSIKPTLFSFPRTFATFVRICIFLIATSTLSCIIAYTITNSLYVYVRDTHPSDYSTKDLIRDVLSGKDPSYHKPYDLFENIKEETFSAPETKSEFMEFMDKADLSQVPEKDVAGKDILDADLDFYTNNISTYVPAISYANSQRAMSDFAWNLSETDRIATDRVVQDIRIALGDPALKKQSFADAFGTIDAVEDHVKKLPLPEGISYKTEKDFNYMKELLLIRWNMIRQLINESEQVSVPNRTIAKQNLTCKYATKLAGKMIDNLLRTDKNSY